MSRFKLAFKKFISNKRESRAWRSSIWILGGFGASQILRLGGNLILTRFLAPEAFGLMALVYGVLKGLELFSDTGIRSAIIHHERGDENAFLNTAWTIQVVRGFVLWGVAVMLAWPMSLAFGQPLLVPLLTIVGITAVFYALRSVMYFVHNRRLEMRRLMVFEFFAQVVGLTTMIVWASIYPSIWALAGGAVVGTAIRAGLSHAMLGPHRHRLMYEKSAGRDLFRFGKWIFVSSSVTFVIGQADRFVVGGLTDMTTLGLFSIAMTLAMVVQVSANAVINRVLFPIFSRVYRTDGRELLRNRMRRTSFILYAFSLPVLLMFVAGGEALVQLLYDPRYASAGGMLKIIATGLIGMMVTNVAAAGLLATGDSRSQAIMQGIRLATFGIATAIGVAMGDLVAFLVAMACARWIDYFPAAMLLRRAGLWNPSVDIPILIISALSIVLIFQWA